MKEGVVGKERIEDSVGQHERVAADLVKNAVYDRDVCAVFDEQGCATVQRPIAAGRNFEPLILQTGMELISENSSRSFFQKIIRFWGPDFLV